MTNETLSERSGYPIILNGDHAEFEAEHAGMNPKDRPDWPLPSFDARDWAKAYMNAWPQGCADEGTMVTWFACALMRGFDERASRSAESPTATPDATEAARAMRVPEWQPFDTAPRDGTRFLAFGGGLTQVESVAYNDRDGCWDAETCTLDDCDNESDGYSRPTIWQPTPEPPIAISLLPLPTPQPDERDEALRVATQAARDVLVERERQKSDEGWTPDHDDENQPGDMSCAAACYALTGRNYLHNDAKLLRFWPWSSKWWKPTDQRRDLVKAGALILAEIERIDRATLAAAKSKGGEG